MAHIEKRKGKHGISYRAHIHLRGIRRKGTFDFQSQAMAWAEEVEHAIRNNLPIPGELASDDKSFTEAVTDYLKVVEKKKGRSRHTILTDRDTAERLIKRFSSKTLQTITRKDIEVHISQRLNEVGPSSVRQDLSFLSCIYKMARTEWRLDINYPGKDIPYPSPPQNRRIILKKNQFDALLNECRASKNKKLYPVVFLLLHTGMRPEEAILLRWHMVEFDNGVIDLTKTKTEPRRVPLTEEALNILYETKPNTAKDIDLVFVSEKTAKKDKPVRFFRRAFEQACIRAKINFPKKRDLTERQLLELPDLPAVERKNVTLYTLRHTAATYLLMNGVDIRTVADILGHKNISQTMKYTHLVDDHKIDAVKKGLSWIGKD